jgi:hypothetical protein
VQAALFVQGSKDDVVICGGTIIGSDELCAAARRFNPLIFVPLQSRTNQF